jgi:hypothetical protein
MKQTLIKADPITLVLLAFWIAAAVWMLADDNRLSDRLFSFAFGLNMGNALRLFIAPARRIGIGRED